MIRNVIFGMAFCLTLVFGAGWNYAVAALGANEVSMGTFVVPKGVQGTDACYPRYSYAGWGTGDFDLTIEWCCGSECNTMTNSYPVNNALSDYTAVWVAQNCAHVFTSAQITNGYTVTETNPCTGQTINTHNVIGEQGPAGNDADIQSVLQVYVPYPSSLGTCTNNVCQHPNQEGYMKTTITYTPESNKSPQEILQNDRCTELMKPVNNEWVSGKLCVAQGSSAVYSYNEGDEYWFQITIPDGYSSHADVVNTSTTLATGYPQNQYVNPMLSNGTTGFPTEPGYVRKVSKYLDNHETYEFVMMDTCNKYAKSTDLSDRVVKCTVSAPGNTLYVQNTSYCLGILQAGCADYDTPVENIDLCTGVGADANKVVKSAKTEYVAHSGTQTKGSVGYKTTYDTMCNGTVNTTVINDTCVGARQTGSNLVTCATGYAWQVCTDQTDTNTATNKYSGCFPDATGGLFAYKDEVVPVNLASTGENLYYCKIQNCDANTACWVNGTVGGTPDSTSDCWGVVNVGGLTGDAGPGCSFVYNNNQWNVCCLPVDATGGVDVNGNWTCKEVEDASILAQLNGWVCKPTYATKYIDASGNEFNSRTATTVGTKTTVTNCDGTFGAAMYAYDDDPCYGLSNEIAAQTVKTKSSVYVPNTSATNIFTPAVGYYENTATMCYGSPQVTYDKDTCTPIADTRTGGAATCNGEHQVYMECRRQDTGATYNICDTIEGVAQGYASINEATGWPKTIYVAPEKNAINTKLIRAGYTAIEHKYLNRNGGVTTEVLHEDTCREAFKRTRTATNATTVTTTVESVLQCTVQAPGATGYVAGETYCLNTDANGSCDGYVTLDDTQTSVLKYHMPTMDSTNTTTPVKPGYTYWQESGTANVVAREIIEETDPCEMVVKPGASGGSSVSTRRCTVLSPGGTGTYASGETYCLGEVNGNCTGYVTVGTMFDDVKDVACGEVAAADKSTTIKSTVRSYVAHVGNTRGYMQLQHSMCDDESTVNDQMPDKCVPVMPANAATCADGTYLECTPQNGGSVYNICESTTGTPINSAIGDVDPCATATTSELKSKTVKTAVTEYHSASGEQTSGARAVGYTTTTQKMCSGTAADDLVITQQDLCERSVTNKGNTTCNAGYEWKTCTHGGTPYYGCFPEENIGKDEVSSDYTDPVFSGSIAPGYLTMTVGGKNVKAYDKCTAVGKAGTGVNASLSGQKCQCGGIKSDGFCTSLGKQYCLGISNDGSCSNALEIGEVLDQNNPCAGANANSTTIVKKITTGAYDRGTVSDGVYPKVGVTQVTKEMCSGTNTEYVEDTCVEIAKPSGVCTPKTSGYLYCLNQTDNTTYYVCKDFGAGNNSIAGKLDEKADASDVTQSALATTLGNTYLKPTDSINAANLSGKVNVERLPDNVVTTTNNKISTDILPNTVVTTTNDKISASILPDSVVTTSSLGSTVSNAITSEVEKGSTGAFKDFATQTSLSGYVKTDGTNLPANIVVTGNTGNNSIGQLLTTNNVVTTGSLGSTVSNAITSEVEKGSTGAFRDFATQTSLSGYVKTDGTNLPASVVTTSGLDNAIAGKTVTFGSKSMTLGDVIELLSSAVGTCTESTVDDRTTTSCTGGSLDLSRTSARA